MQQQSTGSAPLLETGFKVVYLQPLPFAAMRERMPAGKGTRP